MKNLFNGASLFNQPLNSWDVSHVTNMSNVFTGEDNCFTAKEIAQAASLPIHLFRDQAEHNRKRVPHLILVDNLRFSLPAILEWEMANSVKGYEHG